jgi:hypothetical protein
MDMSSAGLDYDADSDILLDAAGNPLSQASYAQFVDAQVGSATPDGDGDEEEEDNGEYEEDGEDEGPVFRKT